jgi:hypothetical protein
MKYLHENFLRAQQEYELNEDFYKNLVQEIIGTESTPFFQTAYGNGQKIYSDHIFSTKYNNRILQIIHREPVSEHPVFYVRVQEWDGEYEMLAISLELSEAVKPVLEKVVKAWLVEGASQKQIQEMLPKSAIKN